MRPFRPYGEDGEVMGYYEVPHELLEDFGALGPWAEPGGRGCASAEGKAWASRRRLTCA